MENQTKLISLVRLSLSDTAPLRIQRGTIYMEI